jgi:hypothetical protein
MRLIAAVGSSLHEQRDEPSGRQVDQLLKPDSSHSSYAYACVTKARRSVTFNPEGRFRRPMTDEFLGPFTVTPPQITALGASFTPFVNALLRAEVGASGLSGPTLTTTYQENVGDEGVDAGLSRAVESRFIPAGESAWQFKRTDLSPAKCKCELRGAAAALEILRAGGKYRLVLGGDINHAQVQRRRKALR